MKKTAIVSCYFQPNYGSMLQALATQMALDKLGYENETIDITGINSKIKKAKILYFMKASVTSGILLTKVGRAKDMMVRKISKNSYTANINIRDNKFREFSKKYFRLSPPYRSKVELGERCKENYTAVLVGSDQLWLPANIAADYYTLNFVPENINSIAYATSFGQSSLPKDSSDRAKVFLRKIKHISIREESGQNLIKQLTGRNVPVVCDPTLLFTGDEWMMIQKDKAIIKEPYIFCYFLGNNQHHREFARRLRMQTGCKIVALSHLDEFVKSDEGYADMTPFDIDPADFLNLIRNATYVCTDSFHCSVFSILFKRKFFTFRRFMFNNKQSTNSRLDTLFKLTGISDRLMNGNEDIKKYIDAEINFEAVHKNIEIIRAVSYEYLKAALENKEGTDL